MLPWMASVFCSFQGQVEGRAGYLTGLQASSQKEGRKEEQMHHLGLKKTSKVSVA